MSETQAERLERLKTKALSMPPSPGVYLMKDQSGRVIYVGKAKSLPKRVTSYFQKQPDNIKTARMVSLVTEVDFFVTDNEKEAFILENSLIKQHRPRYNINLRDDKYYPSLRLDVNDPFPRLEVVRRIKKDGAVYFGPFSSATALRQTIRLIRRLFPLRQCRRPDVTAQHRRPCLNAQLGRCLGPCSGNVRPEEYQAVVDELILFFKGRNRQLGESLEKKMKEAAAGLDYEKAARYRDRLAAVERTLERQKMVSPDLVDRDVVGLAMDRGQALAVIMFVRAGVVLGNQTLALGERHQTPEELVESLLTQYYEKEVVTPAEVLLPVHIEHQELIQEYLHEKRGRVVKVLTPRRGPKKQLIDLARENASSALAERFRAADLGLDAVAQLQKKLSLSAPPRRIEGYDMSTLLGDAPVGALVVLEDGRWIKNDYRRFKIKTASGQDDYAMMREVLERRLSKDDLPRPDLILLDGGRGQLGVARAVVEDLGIQDPPALAGLAKGREGEADKVFLPDRKNPVDLKADSPGLLLLMRIRDEAHRYVRTYHHRLRSIGGQRSQLEDIPGVGPRRRKALLDHFGSVKAIKEAVLEDLIVVKGMTRKAAEAVHRHFHPPGTDHARPVDTPAQETETP